MGLDGPLALGGLTVGGVARRGADHSMAYPRGQLHRVEVGEGQAEHRRRALPGGSAPIRAGLPSREGAQELKTTVGDDTGFTLLGPESLPALQPTTLSIAHQAC